MDHLSGWALFGVVIGAIIGAIVGLFFFIVILVFLIQGIKYFALRQREIYKNNPDLIPEAQKQEEEIKELPKE